MTRRLQWIGFAATALIVLILGIIVLQESSRRERELEEYRRATILEGIQLYAQHCAICHRAGGEGDENTPPINTGDFRLTNYRVLYNTIQRKHFEGESAAYGMSEGGNLTDAEVDTLAQMLEYGTWYEIRSRILEMDLYWWIPVVSGLDNPLFLTHAGDGSGRLFVLEQTGFVLIIENGELREEPFLDISMLLSLDVFTGGYTERGLLGMAFHPDYANNGLFFISHADENGNSVIARYQVSADDPNRADPASRTILITVDQPFIDHNGGHIAFGPDGYLYIGFGDGGNPDLPNYNSQNPQTFLGKMLRIDVNAETYTIPPDNPFVDNPDFLPEIWAWGLRNPWRFSFDRETHDLYIADVGQWLWEELNFQPADSPGGENYGWSAWEATHPYLEDVVIETEVTMPVIEYGHEAGCSITGGYVYRGAAIPKLQGTYLYGDYCNGFIWFARRSEEGIWEGEFIMDTDFVVSSFGEDEAGELYLIDYKGDVYYLEAED